MDEYKYPPMDYYEKFINQSILNREND
jgi:hypothetical protein